MPSCLLIAGTHSGVGKTTVALALMAAFTARGRTVQPFKVGPDFIDPGHHRAACGRDSRNLDGWMLSSQHNQHIFFRASLDADLSIIEGVMGLFDGSAATGQQGSTAEQAKLLKAPVILVIDGQALARSAAALVHGYATFDPDLTIAGVVCNRVKSPGHFQLLKEAIETEAKVPVVGYVRPHDRFAIPERHLGLHMALEGRSPDFYTALGEWISDTLDLAKLEKIASSCASFPLTENERTDKGGQSPVPHRVRVGVAYDRAFCFYYPDNFEALATEGAEIVTFSPLTDQALPEVDLVYIGGGYPELYAETLAANTRMREAIRAFAACGGIVYAECGGLMYLTQGIRDHNGQTHEMVGLFPAEVVISQDKLTLGYRQVEIVQSCAIGEAGLVGRGHEFHVSTLEAKGPLAFSCRLWDAQGREVGYDGLMAHNVIALYTHLHFASQPAIPRALVQRAHAVRSAVIERV
ncbi:MAG: cobyrinate a,c-diamide synthase [Nitrospirae bacterium]|nr:MAG: cobyrinate a,c-diamide synthase [Nitrospirota bacterium]